MEAILDKLGINFIYLFYACIGLFLHFLKSWLAAKKRSEVFFRQETYLFYLINLISSFVIISLAAELPPEIFIVTRLTAVLVGLSSSSLLSGFMKIKMPGEMVTDDDRDILRITKDSRTTTKDNI